MKRMLFLLLLFPLAARSQVLFYAGFEGQSEAYSPDCILVNTFTSKGGPLTVFVYEEGVVGKAARFTWYNGYPGLAYPAVSNYSPEIGSLSFWVRQTGPFFLNRYYPKIWVLGSGQRYEIEEHPLVLVPLNDERMQKISDAKWHHVVITWNLTSRRRKQYLDGELIAEGEYSRPYQPDLLVFGYRLVGVLDEIAVLKKELEEKEVKAVYLAYQEGKRVFSLPRPQQREYPALPLTISHLPDSRPQLPSGANWDLKPAADNGKRVLYYLDGIWRFQPALIEKKGKEIINPGFFGSDWAYISVPGFWKSRNGVKDRDNKVLSDWKGIPWEKIFSVWYERDFSLPPKYKGSQVMLIFPQLAGNAEIYLNSQHLFTSQFSGEVQVNLTEHLLWEGSNRLTVLSGIPCVPEMDVNGISRTPFIEIRSTRSFDLGSPVFCPSVRTGSVKVIFPVENFTYKDLDLVVSANVFSYQDSKLVKTLPGVPLKVEKLFRGEKNIVFPVEGLKCWSPEEPVLYKLVLEVKQGGKTVDITWPEVFGYREIWVEKGTIFLNGIKLSIRGKSHNYLSSYGFSREEIRQLKLTGQNADRTLSPVFPYIDTLQITDEEGWLVFFQAPGIVPDLEAARYEWKNLLKNVGNHPSVVAWQWSGNGYLNGPHGHPMQIGGVIPEEVIRQDENYVRARKVKELDPTGRPVFYYRLGTGGDFRGIMTTLGFGTPLQEAEEWVSYWAKTRQDPLVPTEMQVYPIHHEGFLWQKGSKEIVLLEHHARFFGDLAYQKLTSQHLESYAAADKGVSLWLGPDSEYKNDIYSLTYSRLLPSWRTYGVGGYLFHVFFKTSELFSRNQLNKFGQTLKRVNSPVLFYIGGPKADFVNKEHNFWIGEKVEKSFITVNDSFHPLKASINWKAVTETGEVLGVGMVDISVPAGGIDFQPITLQTESWKKKTKVNIEAELTAENFFLSDSFQITFFPREDRKIKQVVAVVDSTGETVRVLEKMGVPLQIFDENTIDAGQWTWQKFPLLIIGKNSYPYFVKLCQKHLPFGEAVKEGLNVLILEQTCRQVAGLTVENGNLRQVFIRERNCPLLLGLENQDLTDWRGESYLLPAYQSWHPESNFLGESASKHGQLNSFGQRRFWHWSNKGMVATFAYEKPQLGNFRVLLDCGFDLLYTPLVEVQEGKGRILFNQLDLVDHYGIEPVATILLQRMIENYLQPVSKNWRKLGFIGDARDKNFLEQLGVCYQENSLADVVYLNPGFAGESLSAEKIASFLNDGGILIVTLKSEADCLKLPVKIRLEKRKVNMVEVPGDPEFAGLGPGDFFYRSAVETLQVVSVREEPVKNGLAGVILCGKGKIIYLQITPEIFERMWQKSKVFRIYSTVLANLGIENKFSVDTGAISGYGIPEEWLPGYSVAIKNLEQRPMSGKGKFYLSPALDFDPDQHHVW